VLRAKRRSSHGKGHAKAVGEGSTRRWGEGSSILKGKISPKKKIHEREEPPITFCGGKIDPTPGKLVGETPHVRLRRKEESLSAGGFNHGGVEEKSLS